MKHDRRRLYSAGLDEEWKINDLDPVEVRHRVIADSPQLPTEHELAPRSDVLAIEEE